MRKSLLPLFEVDVKFLRFKVGQESRFKRLRQSFATSQSSTRPGMRISRPQGSPEEPLLASPFVTFLADTLPQILGITIRARTLLCNLNAQDFKSLIPGRIT
jgi:hypothetical protein